MSHWRRAWLLAACLSGMAWLAPPSFADRPTDHYSTLSKTATVTAVTTDGVLWTPASGKAAAVMGCAVSSGGAQQTLLEINNAAILPNIYTAADANYSIHAATPIAEGNVDQTVTYTTTSSTTTTINCWGFEFQE